ncbi:MAG: flippase [Bacteroidota bacterium]
MSEGARIRKNSFFALSSQLIRLLTNFLLFVGIARYYGEEAFGQFTTAHTLSAVFLLFADFGFDMLLPTEISRNRHAAAAMARKYFSFKILFALLATVGMMALPLAQAMSPSTRTLVEIFSFYVLLSSLNNFFFALFKGFEEFQHETRISLAVNVVLLTLLVVLGIVHAPLYVIALAFVGTRLIGIVSCFSIAKRLLGGFSWRFSTEGWGEVWRHVVVFGLQFVFGNLFFQLDTILLAFLRGDRDVGVYQAVFKLVILTLVIPDILVNTMAPVLSRLHSQDRETWNRVGRLLNKTLSLLALPIALVLFIFPDQLVNLIYGPTAFRQSIPILRIFACTILIRFEVEAYALTLTTSHRQASRLMVVIIGTLTNIALNVFAIPAYGPIGAAFVSLFTNLLVGIGYVVTSKQSVLEWTFNPRILVVSGFGLCAAAGLWQVRNISMFYTVPVLVAFYGGLLYFVGFTRDEWSLFLTGKRRSSLV